MELYYFHHPSDTSLPTETDWFLWNLAIPMKDSPPKEGDTVLLINASTLMHEIIWVGPQDNLRKWRRDFPEKMMMHIMSAIFQANFSDI